MSTASTSSPQADRSTHQRAIAGYDAEFRRRLTEVIGKAIGQASMLADAPVLVLRTSATLNGNYMLENQFENGLGAKAVQWFSKPPPSATRPPLRR